MKILTIIGARPQIIKAAAVSRAVANVYSDRIEEKILHTGQHYDKVMSGLFFEELNIPEPDVNLAAGGGSQASRAWFQKERMSFQAADLRVVVRSRQMRVMRKSRRWRL